MIKDVPLTGVFVNDQDAALDFYTNKLGLEQVQDEPYGESGARWITVSPTEMRIRIVLKKAEREHEKAMVGRSDGPPVLTLGTDDVRSAYEALRERGVDSYTSRPSLRCTWSWAVCILPSRPSSS
jgi:catechol 2,3-dioxygenase-like lactoylglutathione lyase family enzyme